MYVVPYNRSRPTRRTPWCVYTLIALNVAVYIATTFLMDPRDAAFRYGFIPARNAPLTWLTHLFLHATTWHVVASMFFLCIFGVEVESALGPLGLGLSYLVSGLAGVVLLRAANPAATISLVGGSAAIDGVVGLYIILCPRALAAARAFVRRPSATAPETQGIWAILFWVALQVLLSMPRRTHPIPAVVPFWAGLGGLAVGLLVGLLLPRLGFRERYERHRRACQEALPSTPLPSWQAFGEMLARPPLIPRTLIYFAFFLLCSIGPDVAERVRPRPFPPSIVGRQLPTVAEARHPGWTGYTTVKVVSDLAFDRMGNLWVVGSGGVVRWDPGGRTYTKYSVADGLADNGVDSVAVGPDGKLWFATRSGLSCFDGEHWTTYTARDGLPSGRIHTVSVAPDGTVWVGTQEEGVSRFDGRTWTIYTTAHGLAGNRISSSAVTRDGTAWFGTHEGLSRFDGRNWTTYLLHAESLGAAPDGALWVGTGSEGLFRFDGTAWTQYTTADGLANNWIRAVAVGPSGEVWAISGNDLCGLADGRWVRFTCEEGPLGRWPTVVAAAPDGALWLGASPDGLYRFDGKEWPYHVYDRAYWTQYLTADGPAGSEVTAVAVGSEGTLWFGTYFGLCSLDGQRWATHTIGDGRAEQSILSISVAPDGAVWCGTESNGAARFDGRRWTTYRSLHNLSTTPSLLCSAVAADRAVWFGSIGPAYRFDGRSWMAVVPGSGEDVRAIAPAPGGEVWFASSRGVSTLDEGSWTVYTSANGLVGQRGYALAVDSVGTVWCGTDGGVSRFDGWSWTSYTTADGLVDNLVQAIAVAPDGALWFGTPKGASRLDGTTWTTYTTANGLMDNNVQAIAVAPDGAVWFGTSRGISRFEGGR